MTVPTPLEVRAKAPRLSASARNRDRRAYRAFMRASEPATVLTVVEREFREWLQSKDVNLNSGDPDRPEATLHTATEGGTQYLGCSLTEPSPLGVWRTEIIASSAGWIHLVTANSERRTVDVPRIARALMRSLDLRDASMKLEDDVRLWDVGDIDQLVDLLLDPDRHGLVFVGGTGPDPGVYEEFRKRLPRWSREAYGLAQSVLLTPQATWELAERLEIHAVSPWSIRTYLPGVRPGSVADARRHRYLSLQTLTTQPNERTKQLLAHVARSNAAERQTPPEVVAARRALERADAHAVMQRLRATKAPSILESRLPSRPEQIDSRTSRPEPDERAHQLEIVKRVLGLDEISEQSLTDAVAQLSASSTSAEADLQDALGLMEEQLDRIDTLEDDLRAAQDLLDGDLVDLAELSADNDALQKQISSGDAEIRWLRSKLAEGGDRASSFAAAPPESAGQDHDSCSALIAALENDDVLVFTGDPGVVAEIDECDTFRTAVREADRACLSLREYARAKADGCDPKGVDHFLRNRPTGYQGTSPGKHAVGETGATMRRFGSERIFPVPTDVDQSGAIVMRAHFKLARIGMISPRLYYYDDLPRTGKIYIGYLGRHLTNTMS